MVLDLPPGSRKVWQSYQRILSALPLCSHSSMRLVQQPSSTCCESTTSCRAGCSYEHALPPTYGLRSSTVTLFPTPARAAAAASPAPPPPTTITSLSSLPLTTPSDCA